MAAQGEESLVEGYLREEKRTVKFPFKRAAQGPVAGAEFRLEVIAVLLDDVIKRDDGVAPADPLAEPPPRKHRRKLGRRLRVAAASFATELNSPSAPERQPELRGPIASC